MPQEYYEAYQLEEKVTKPCQVNGIDSLCNQFSYLSTRKPGLFTSELETGYIIRRGRRQDTQLFKNESVQEQLDFTAMALLDRSQVRSTLLGLCWITINQDSKSHCSTHLPPLLSILPYCTLEKIAAFLSLVSARFCRLFCKWIL